MAFANDKPARSLTWPPGAGTGTTRIVVGADTPPELLSYGIQVAILFYISDATDGVEEGYTFIASSNVLDTGSKDTMLMGHVVYPTRGVPSSATAANVKTHFQLDMNQSNADPTPFTVFKDHSIDIQTTVPQFTIRCGQVNFSTLMVLAAANQFLVDGGIIVRTGGTMQVNSGANLQSLGTLVIGGATFLGTPNNASPRKAKDVAVTNGTTTSTAFVNTLTTTGTFGIDFVAPPSGSVFIYGSCGGFNNTAGSYTLVSFEIRTGAVLGSGTVFQASDENSASQNQSAVASDAGQHSVMELVTGLTAGTTYNVCLTYRVTANTGSFNRQKINVLPTL